MMKRAFLWLLLFSCSLVSSVTTKAEDNGAYYVPPALAEWKTWVEQKDPFRSCAVLGSTKTCEWPASLVLDLDEAGGTFSYEVGVDREELVMLPGGELVWPQGVVAEGSGPVVVVERERRPFALLTAGDVRLTGHFSWQAMPESLLVPANAALVTLKVGGNKVDYLSLSQRGVLLLKQLQQKEEVEENTLAVTVQRKLADGLPFRIATRLEVRVGGKARNVSLGEVLPVGAMPIQVKTTSNYRYDGNREFILQARPGVHVIIIDAVYDAPPSALRPVANNTVGWPEQEVWVWQPNERLRSAEVKGAPHIDPSHTSLPKEWYGHETFVVSPGNELVIAETRRGEPEPAQNTLSLSREIRLDLDGNGATVVDRFSGNMNREWRLNYSGEGLLGRVLVDGNGRLITTDPQTKATGIEVRQSNVSVQAESRVSPLPKVMKAIGWNQDVVSLDISLILPPGWKLFHAGSIPNVSGAWTLSWTLLDLFVLVVAAVASFKLFGKRYALLFVLLLALLHGEKNAPVFIWFHLLASLALLRVLPPNFFRKIIFGYFAVALFVFLVLAIPFSYAQVLNGLFPQLDYAQVLESFGVEKLFALAQIVFPAALIGGVIFSFITSRWKLGLSLLGGLAFLFVLYRSTTSTYFAADGASEQYMDRGPAPVAAPLMEEKEDKVMALGRRKQAAINAGFQAEEELTEVDPNAVIQSGFGLPTWNGDDARLSWNGPVTSEETFGLYLLSPTVNLILAISRVILIILLLLPFLKQGREVLNGRVAAAVCLLFVLFVHAGGAEAQESYPNEQLLNELEQRLDRDRCQENCAHVNELKLSVRDDQLELEAAVTSKGAGAVGLPGPDDQVFYTEIQLDGKPFKLIRREADNLVWVRIPNGSHTLHAFGGVRPKNSLSLQFGSTPGAVTIDAPQWEVEGVSSTRSISGQVKLTRRESLVKQAGEVGVQQLELPNWYSVERTIFLAVPWTVSTKVTLLGDLDSSHLVRIPLLPNEAANTSLVRVENQEALVSFGRGVREVMWDGTLQETPKLEFQASQGRSITESINLRCSTIFQCKSTGVKPIATISNGVNLLSWNLWPGEKLGVAIAKPRGVPGKVSTVDVASLHFFPGLRRLSGELTLSVRTTVGGFQEIFLPEDAEVTSVTLNGKSITLTPESGKLELPIAPGQNYCSIYWWEPRPFSLFSSMPKLTVSGGAVNISSSVSLPDDRWVLYATGPKWGPVFRYWGELLVLLIISAFLGVKRVGGLNVYQWMLLGAGLSMLPVYLMIVPPAWLVLLHYRKIRAPQSPFAHNSFQLLIVGLGLLSLVVFYKAISQGLIGAPDMGIVGYDATSSILNWYLDRTDGPLPPLMIVSVPLYVWHLVMFAWSCWLGLALIKWLGLAWQLLSSELWRKAATNVAGEDARINA